MVLYYNVIIVVGVLCSLVVTSKGFHFKKEDYHQVLAITEENHYEVHDLIDKGQSRDCYIKELPYKDTEDPGRFDDLIAVAVGDTFIACDNFTSK
jgi:hypothetical protein